MNIHLVYVCPVVNWPQFEPATRRFVSTFKQFPPEFPHTLHVVCNGGKPNAMVADLFAGLNPVFHEHDNSGWDIGAYRKVAGEVDADFMLFLNAHSHFRQAGWLRRLAAGAEQFGPGLYGPSASFDIAPHIRTTAFMCRPQLVRDWTGSLSQPDDRHYFEVGRQSITSLAGRQNMPCVLVTWEGFYPQPDWRKPANIFRRGDQSNCLIYDRHHEIYEAGTPAQKDRLGRIADGDKWSYYHSAVRGKLNRWLNRKTSLCIHI